VPVGRGAVVDDRIGAQRLQPLRLLLARRGGEDAGAKQLGELEGEQRDAARAEREDRLTRRQRRAAAERVPRGRCWRPGGRGARRVAQTAPDVRGWRRAGVSRRAGTGSRHRGSRPGRPAAAPLRARWA
jgi:hypothetical protein